MCCLDYQASSPRVQRVKYVFWSLFINIEQQLPQPAPSQFNAYYQWTTLDPNELH